MRLPLLAAARAVLAPFALAEPAIVYSTGGKFDKSFNEGAWNGAKQWAEETGGTFAEFEIDSPAQSEQALRSFARRGNSPIVAIGFTHANALAKVAPEFPDAEFVLVDMVVDAPNVRSVVYREHEGGYVVGVIAALTSDTGTLGFVGGMDIPLIRKFACGYAQGVKAVNPDANVIANMTGTTPAAWNAPVKGSELTKAQISQGADVVYAAAGGTGVGVLQTAADEDILSIGVDSTQNYLHSGKVQPSMLKRVDVAVYDSMKAGEGMETGGFTILGLAEEGVGVALDEHNDALVTDEMEAAVAEARDKIISGDLEVVAYYTNDSCPVLDF